MINIKELRKGNLVKHPNGEGVIKHFVKDIVNFEDGEVWSCDVIEPIIINNEWLLSVGAIIDESNWCTHILRCSFEQEINISINPDKTVHVNLFDVEDDQIFYISHMTAIHNLQNMYQLLTEEELTPKKDNDTNTQ